MKFLNLTAKTGKLPNRDFSQWLNEAYIDPLKELGFKCDLIASMKPNPESLDFHILTFTHDGVTPCRKDWLDKICIQDDDSQPLSSYSSYLGQLWLTIPYLP